MIEALVAGLKATTPLEAVSVVLGFAYSVLAVMRVRWCWVAGGVSSGILVYLAARAQLPMQAVLQAYYIAMAVYGFWHWSGSGNATRVVTTLPIKLHMLALLSILLVSAASAHWLAKETAAAWPFLDSFTTWMSLFATWLVARVKLENWLYWIVADSISVFLFGAQGLIFVATLFAVYLVVSVVGFIAWRKDLRAHVPAT